MFSPVTCSHPGGDHRQPQFDRRTTWPTETGTMVRILRSDPNVNDAFATGSDEDFSGSSSEMGKRVAGPLDYIMKKKRDLFLRTSKRMVAQEEEDDMGDKMMFDGQEEYSSIMGKRGGKNSGT